MLARCTFVLMLAAAGAAAQFPPTESAKLTGDFWLKSYGRAVATDGERVVVGSPYESLDCGRVYVYRREGGRSWVLEDSFQPDTPAQLDNFGAAVDLDGDVLVVGAPGESLSTNGKAFVFRWNGADWVQELVVTGESAADNLGTDVGVHGDLAAFGAPGDDDVVGNGGAVLVYRHDGAAWGLEEKLRPAGGLVNGHVGTTVAVADERVLAGGVAGQAHVYARSGELWTVEQTLTGDVGAASGFGLALAIDGDLALVGAEDEFLGGFAFGAAYLFRLSCGVWEREAKLVSPQPDISLFGAAVDVDGGVAVVGDWAHDGPGITAGAAWVWRWDGILWEHEQSLVPTDLAAGDHFGVSVAVGGDVIVVGSTEDDNVTPDAGASYVFEGTPVHQPWTDLGGALAGGAGDPALRGGGSLVVGQAVEVSVRCGLPGAPAVLVAGLSTLGAPFKGGVLWPHPDVLLPIALDGGGQAELLAVWPPGAPSGFDFALQAWITDPAGPAGLAATNGVLGTVP